MFGGQNRRYTPRPQWLSEIKKRQSVFVHFALALTAFIYMVIGALLFMWLEAEPEHEDGSPALNISSDHPTGGKAIDLSLSHPQKMCLLQILQSTENGSTTATKALGTMNQCFSKSSENQWRFPTALLFTFTVITTIGYGNIAPVTTIGRLFCIIYGLIGIPLTMMAIANVGKFLTDMGRKGSDRLNLLLRPIRRRIRRFRHERQRLKKLKEENTATAQANGHNHKLSDDIETGVVILNNEETDQLRIEEVTPANTNRAATLEDGAQVVDADDMTDLESEDDSGEEYSSGFQTAMVLLAFFIYVCVGGFILPLYEEDMSFFTALYFNFVTLTTVGLGDMVPTSEKFLLFTMFYITIGLALTTIAIEVASDYLQKLHHFGKPIENTGNTTIWFGGKKITMKKLMQNVGEKYGIKELEHPEMLPNLLDTIVDAAIQKNENENFELPKLGNPEPEPEPEPEPVPMLQEAPKTPSPEPIDQGDPIKDEESKILCEILIVNSEKYDKYAPACPPPRIKSATGYFALESCEMVPFITADYCALDLFDTFECATEVIVSQESMECALIGQDAFPPLPLIFGAVFVHLNEPQYQELPEPTPPPSPPPPPKPKKVKQKHGKVDLSKVNDPKKRYELYQKEWARYNTHLMETKAAKAAAQKEREARRSAGQKKDAKDIKNAHNSGGGASSSSSKGSTTSPASPRFGPGTTSAAESRRTSRSRSPLPPRTSPTPSTTNSSRRTSGATNK